MKNFLTIIGFFVLLLFFGNAWACDPSTPGCNCNSDSSSLAVGVGVGIADSESKSNSSLNSKISNNINNQDLSYNNNQNFVNTSGGEGGSVSFKEGDTTVNQGDLTNSIGDTILDSGDMDNSSNSSVGNITSATGDNINEISYNSVYKPGIRLPNATPTSVQIGNVKKSTTSLSFFGGIERDPYFTHSPSILVGASINIPLDGKTGINGALSVAKQKIEKERDFLVTQNIVLSDENNRSQEKHEQDLKIIAERHEQDMLFQAEKHQAEMAEICMSLHKYILSTGKDFSPELLNRCSGFTHSNNERTNKLMEEIPPKGRHNQEMNPNQMSPHFHNDEYRNKP
jgi:hypothetical protein